MTIIFNAEPSQISKSAIELLENSGFQVIESLDNMDSSNISGLFIRTYTKVDKLFLDKFRNLEFILRAGVGLDNIDVEECKKRNISIFNSPGANAEAVAEYILGMSIYQLRKIDTQLKSAKEGNWRNLESPGVGIAGLKFGLIGCGNVGRSVAKKLSYLGAECLGYDPYVDAGLLSQLKIKKYSLDELLSVSDVIVVVIPLTDSTKGLISKEKLALIKPTAHIINVSRGEIIDEIALAQALATGAISGAVLDVVTGEPIINQDLLNIPTLIITPHIAGFTVEANENIAVQAVNNFLSWKSN